METPTVRTTARVLKAVAMQWLRYERGHMVVTMERVPCPRWCGIPDVIGVNLRREVTEIEIKCTVADFKNNEKKRCRQQRIEHYTRDPHLYYFLVPRDIVEKVKPLLVMKGAGLMTITEKKSGYTKLPMVEVVVNAQRNPSAQPLSVKELAYVVKDQSGTLVSLMCKLAQQ